jgi:hypothetical protein
MKELLAAIEKVRKRIEHYREDLQRSEMLTRYVLVDPILRALGWDTEDPKQVVPEYRTEVGRPDYVLKFEGDRTDAGARGFLLGVEAKRLGADDHTFEEARRRALPLFQEKNIRYYIITDGDRWVLWDISRPKEESPHPIFDVRLSRDNPGVAARKLLALWRPAMPEVEEAVKPIAGEPIGTPPVTPLPDEPPEVVAQFLRNHTYPKWGASRLLRETLIKCGMHWKQAGKVADKFRDQLELRKPLTGDDLKRFWHAVKEVYEKHSQQLSGVNLEGFERQMEEVAKEEHFRFKQRKERQTS